MLDPLEKHRTIPYSTGFLGTFGTVVGWNKLRVYLNNEEATPSINANGNLTGSPTFYIIGDNQLNSEMFSGAIDDFRIYAHALNPKKERMHSTLLALLWLPPMERNIFIKWKP